MIAPYNFALLKTISITNLAERHLRLSRIMAVAAIALYKDINHESSRKAFETLSLDLDSVED